MSNIYNKYISDIQGEKNAITYNTCETACTFSQKFTVSINSIDILYKSIKMSIYTRIHVNFHEMQ